MSRRTGRRRIACCNSAAVGCWLGCVDCARKNCCPIWNYSHKRNVVMTPQDERILAEQIARTAHAVQIELSTGDPYIRHLERVVALVEADPHVSGDQVLAVAWLHDVLEDTTETVDSLQQAGLSEAVIDAVRQLTRTGEVYAEYIDQMRQRGHPWVYAVKLADLADHLRPNCPPSLRPRYERAREVLLTTRTV